MLIKNIFRIIHFQVTKFKDISVELTECVKLPEDMKSIPFSFEYFSMFFNDIPPDNSIKKLFLLFITALLIFPMSKLSSITISTRFLPRFWTVSNSLKFLTSISILIFLFNELSFYFLNVFSIPSFASI